MSSPTPFLTDLDTRAQVKGSVDPLGAMPIWTRMGRRVVGNLTTVSNSVRDFKTLVVGFGLLEDVRRRNGPEQDTDELATFLRWEQLAAYTRGFVSNDFTFRGVRRVQRQLEDGPVVPISAERDCQILGNQKVYGLWGLFTVPGRASGLLDKDANTLTADAEAYLQTTWRRELSRVWPGLVALLNRDTRRYSLDRNSAELKQLSALWRKYLGTEREVWQAHIVRGGPADKTDGRQAILAGLLRESLADDEFALSQRTVRALATKARRLDERLSADLLDIAASESVLVYATVLFSYLQTMDGRSIEFAIEAIRKAWPARLKPVDAERFAGLELDLAKASGSATIAREWLALADDLAGGQYREAVPRLLAINKLVMGARGGAPWVADEAGTIRVKYRDGAGALPDAAELPDLWKYPYFISSLRAVVAELEAA